MLIVLKFCWPLFMLVVVLSFNSTEYVSGWLVANLKMKASDWAREEAQAKTNETTKAPENNFMPHFVPPIIKRNKKPAAAEIRIQTGK